jgi:hypothetical protein
MATDFCDGCCGDMHAQVVALDAREALQITAPYRMYIQQVMAQAARLREIVQIAQDVQAAGIRVRAVVSPLVHNLTGGEG